MSKKYKFLENIYYKVSNKDIRILLPEADIDDRVFQASIKLTLDNICKVSVIGDSKSLIKKYNQIDKTLIEKIKIFDIESNNQDVIKFAHKLYKKRKHKGLTQEHAYELMHNINYYACMLLDEDQVDGVVTGATFTTREVFKPALQIIGTKDIYHRISSYFIMNLNETTYFFADCAVNINPDSNTLSEIAIDTALTAKKMDIEPKVAFLSFSTNNSAEDESIDKVRKAVEIAQKKEPKLKIDGEMQVDSAIVPEVRKRKYPDSKYKEPANILIFPDLNSGNIAYKLVQRIAGYKAIGPILQGLRKPLNDLSRGCSTQDVYEIAALTAFEKLNNLS